MSSKGAYGENEETVLEMEENILKELEDVTGKVEQISQKEENFLGKMKNGEHPNKVENSIKDLMIFLEDDVASELKDIENKVQSLRDTVSRNQGPHADLVEKLSHTLGLMEKEEQRFHKILEKAERHIENAHGPEDVKKVEKKIVEFEESEEKDVMHEVEQEIKASEKEWKQIRENQARKN